MNKLETKAVKEGKKAAKSGSDAAFERSEQPSWPPLPGDVLLLNPSYGNCYDLEGELFISSKPALAVVVSTTPPDPPRSHYAKNYVLLIDSSSIMRLSSKKLWIQSLNDVIELVSFSAIETMSYFTVKRGSND